MRNETGHRVVCAIVIGLMLAGLASCESKAGKDGAQKAANHEKVAIQRDTSRHRQMLPPAQPLETIQGIVYLSGNEPFVHLALEGLDGKVYYLTGEKEEDLRHLQNRMVRVTGYLRPARAGSSDRDTVEVVGFEVVHSEGD